MDKPYYEIDNQYYLLYYCHHIITNIIGIEEERKYKILLYGIIQMDCVECPNPVCPIKTDSHVFLPNKNQWNDRAGRPIDDEIFLKFILIGVLDYFIAKEICLVDIYLNLSFYHLKITGNYCEAIYNSKKVSQLELSYQEEFSFQRLNLKISEELKSKLKYSNEQISSLEFLDVSQFYKYDFLSQNFLDEISNDINLSLDFWNIFRAPLKDNSKNIDFNKVYKLTDKIRISKSKIEKMWEELLSIYNGVNELFELYSEYLIEMNDDDLKKRELDSLKRKYDNYNDHLNQNFYSILFSKDTGIIIANGDKGSEGVIELANKEINNIFKYKINDLKGKNLYFLMPKLFRKEHNQYIRRYIRVGEKRIIDNNNFYSFGKDKYNNILKIKLMIKLFPILNKSILFVGLVVKDNIDDIIFMDEKFNIQGISFSLIKKFGISNYIFEEAEIPFYVICKKFVNFYSMLLSDTKKNDENNCLKEKKLTINEEKELNNLNIKKIEDNENKNIIDNLEINENIELEYEIKIPNFLLDFSEESLNNIKSITMEEIQENLNINVIEEDENEDEPLIGDKKLESKLDSKSKCLLQDGPQKNKIKASTIMTKGETPYTFHNNTLTPGSTPTPEEKDIPTEEKLKNSDINEKKKKIKKILLKYQNLFQQSKFSDLEELIDFYNLNSIYEYKFNFTFDRYKFGNNQMAYVVRCIELKNDSGKSAEETINEVDLKGLRYKKEKIEAIKPLYELFPKEKDILKEQTDNFIKLSLENSRLQKALQACKEDIKEMSIAYGQKEDIIIKDENSSQISQSGFDSGLVKKNRIDEIKSNLLVNIQKFYIFKYIKSIIILMSLFTIVFAVIYILLFLNLYHILKDVSLINIKLFQNCLWTCEIVSIFISLRTLKKNIFNHNFIFNNYKEKENDDNFDYYNRMSSLAKTLYFDLLSANEALEKDISKYLEKNELMNLYWDKINISYVKENYTKYFNEIDTESFPMAMGQFLSSCISFLTNKNFNISNEAINNYNSLSIKDKNELDIYSEHILYLIIENAYDNILPNHFKKIETIPENLRKYNENTRTFTKISIFIYSCIMICLCAIYYILLYITNKSLTDGLTKVTKIRLEQVEETIKVIENFNTTLKSLRDKNYLDEEKEINDELLKDNQVINKKIDNENNNNNKDKNIGFNLENNKTIPLKTLKYSYIMVIYNICILLAFLSTIYYYTSEMVKKSNDLLLVEKYIYGNLIKASIQTVEIKCFMSNCSNKKNLDYSKLSNTKLLIEIIKGVKSFQLVNDFYENNFLLNACGAAYKNNTNYIEYQKCINDTLIISGNNTDSLIRLINDLYENIKKEYYIQIEKNNDNKKINISNIKLNLYATDYFQLMEKIYYKYIFPIGKNFAKFIIIDLNDFLNIKKTLIIMSISFQTFLIVIFCIFFGTTLIKSLIHYLSVSRCIMKIIPTSVIINTQELESWIENKYSF